MEQKFELNRKVFRNGDVVIYMRPNLKDPKWQCRVHVPGGTGYVIRSTKTKDEFEARRFAEDLWDELRLKVRLGGKIKSKSVDKLFAEFVSYFEQTASSPRRVLDVTTHLQKYIIPFLSKRPIEAIQSTTVTDYIDWRRRPENYLRRQPKNNTLRAELTSWKVFMDWAVKRGHTNRQIVWELPSAGKDRRPDFNRQDWRKLTRFLREWIKEGKTEKGGGRYRERLMLCNYALILANTGIRVGEARELRWRDFDTDNRQIGDKVVLDCIFKVSGKTGSREVVASSPDVVEYLKRIYELRVEELGKKPAEDEFIFCHRDGSKIGSFKKGLESLFRAAGVLKSEDGSNRTAYSFRHTYATMRLEEGVNPYHLAQNMGTSVKMIENFYGHTTNRSMAAELTKRKDRSQSSSRFPWVVNQE
jgi:integrase